MEEEEVSLKVGKCLILDSSSEAIDVVMVLVVCEDLVDENGSWDFQSRRIPGPDEALSDYLKRKLVSE